MHADNRFRSYVSRPLYHSFNVTTRRIFRYDWLYVTIMSPCSIRTVLILNFHTSAVDSWTKSWFNRRIFITKPVSWYVQKTALSVLVNIPKTKLKKLHGLSPRANYTDRATAACRRSDCQLFADRWCQVISVTDPYGRILGLLDRSRYVSIKYLLSCTHEAVRTPLQTHYFFLVVPGIEPASQDL
jgi:hypothetical protein